VASGLVEEHRASGCVGDEAPPGVGIGERATFVADSSPSSSVSTGAPQFTATNGRDDRGPRWWMARATALAGARLASINTTPSARQRRQPRDDVAEGETSPTKLTSAPSSKLVRDGKRIVHRRS
jgi:hypothetical protein